MSRYFSRQWEYWSKFPGLLCYQKQSCLPHFLHDSIPHSDLCANIISSEKPFMPIPSKIATSIPAFSALLLFMELNHHLIFGCIFIFLLVYCLSPQLEVIYSFMHQIFIASFLCARHYSRHWACTREQGPSDPSPQRAYVLMGKTNNKQENKYRK